MTSVVIRELIAVVLAFFLGSAMGPPWTMLAVVLLYLFYLVHSRNLWNLDRSVYPAFFHVVPRISVWLNRRRRQAAALDVATNQSITTIVDVVVGPIGASTLWYVADWFSFLNGSTDRYTGNDATEPDRFAVSLVTVFLYYLWTVSARSEASKRIESRGLSDAG